MAKRTFKAKIKPAWAMKSPGQWFHTEGNKNFIVKQSEQYPSFLEVTEGPHIGKTILKEACIIQ